MPMLPTLLHATKWLNLIQRGTWVYASRRKPDAPLKPDSVSIIAWHNSTDGTKRLVITEEFRIPIQRSEFSMPAGLLETNETPFECAKRELHEETGFLVTNDDANFSGVTYSSAGMTDETTIFVDVNCEGEPSKTPGVDNEQIIVHLFNRSDCQKLLERNRQGEAAISVKLWPILASIAKTGEFAGDKIS